MKITFYFYVDEKYRNYIGDDDLTEQDYNKRLEIDWNFPLPEIGQIIRFGDDNDDHFADREFTITSKYWLFNESVIELLVHADGGEK